MIAITDSARGARHTTEMNGHERHSRDYGGAKVTVWTFALAAAGFACLVAALALR